MVLYLALTLVTVWLAWHVTIEHDLVPVRMAQQASSLTRSETINRICLGAIFFLMFVVSAFRTGIGNDYERYVEFVHLIEFDQVVPTEIGFNLLVKLINGLSGFENAKLMFAIYAFVTILLFLVGMYRQSVDFPLTFFLFMTLGYYFQTMNTVRYYLALAIAFVCLRYVRKGQYVRFALLTLLGATFHKSLLVILPLYLIARIPWKKWMLAIGALFSISFVLFQDFYLQVVVFLYPSYRDTEYLEGGTSIPNILRCFAVLVFGLIYYKKCVEGNEENRFYFQLNLGACVLYTCCSFLPIISRIGYYLTISHILFIPSVLKGIEKEQTRIPAKVWRILIILAGCGYFALFLWKAKDVAVGLLPYETWLFTL